MQRHQSLRPLSRDHRDGLFLALLLKRDAKPIREMPTSLEGKRDYALNEWQTKVRPHFDAEEHILIPMVRGQDADVDALITEILQEHVDITHLVETLPQASDLQEHLHAISVALEAHIRKEERQWFERIQSVLPQEVLDQLGEQLDAYEAQRSRTCGL